MQTKIHTGALKEITMDDVRRLRYEGHGDEAEKLLRIFRINCKKNKKQLEKEIKQNDNKIRRTICKKNNICTVCGHRMPRPKRVTCYVCAEYKKKYLKKKYKEEKTL